MREWISNMEKKVSLNLNSLPCHVCHTISVKHCRLIHKCMTRCFNNLCSTFSFEGLKSNQQSLLKIHWRWRCMSLNKKLKGILRSNVVEELSSNSNGCQTCMRPQWQNLNIQKYNTNFLRVNVRAVVMLGSIYDMIKFKKRIPNPGYRKMQKKKCRHLHRAADSVTISCAWLCVCACA